MSETENLPSGVTFGVSAEGHVRMIVSHNGLTQVVAVDPATARMWAKQIKLLTDSIDARARKP